MANAFADSGMENSGKGRTIGAVALLSLLPQNSAFAARLCKTL